MINAAFPVVAPLAGSGTTTADYIVGNPLDVGLSLDSLVFIDDAGITANDTNYATISVELDGVEVATISTTTTDSGNIAADTPKVISVSNANLLAAAAGGKINFKLAKAGTGVAVAGRVLAVFRPHA